MSYSDRYESGTVAEASAIMGFERVVACVGSGAPAKTLISHARAVAKALSLPLLLLRVCETRALSNECLDPVEWEIRRRETSVYMDDLVAGLRQTYEPVDAVVIEGKAAEQISQWAAAYPRELLVLGIHGESWPAGNCLGSTVREVADHVRGSLLLVPGSAGELSDAGYRRVLVPMDGSCRAESVLPVAMHLAQEQDAELLLVHVVPSVQLTDMGLAGREDIELCERLMERNERIARQYLHRLQSRVSEKGIVVHTRVLCADVRSTLARVAADEGVDLIVLSAQGKSGRLDVPYGSVAAFIMTHTMLPLLVMRPPEASNGLGKNHTASLSCRLQGAR